MDGSRLLFSDVSGFSRRRWLAGAIAGGTLVPRDVRVVLRRTVKDLLTTVPFRRSSC